MILFYEALGAYGYFSNFSRHAILLEGKTWGTSEHYFQAMKSTDPAVQERIRGARTPGQAARLGRTTSLRPEWDLPINLVEIPSVWAIDIPNPLGCIERFKDLVMLRAVRAKFTQHAILRDSLLDTDNDVLVEDAMADPYWGWGCSKNGINKLGQILMFVREMLRHGQG